MAEKTANETRCVVLADSQACKTVICVAKTSFIESQVTSEECQASEPVKKRDDLLILHPFAADVMADLTGANSPTSQKLPLVFGDILIKNVHSPAGTKSSLWESSNSRASRTDSAIAPFVMAPRHCSIMASQAIPLATCSSTSETKMRVPRKVGSP